MLTASIYFVIRLSLVQIYPAYNCFKAIKLDDHRQFLPLLIYWVSSTVFLVAEYFADLLVFWIPFYTELKLLLVLWITLPQTKGAIVLYADFIEPFLTRHEARIDKAMVEIQENTKHTLSVYGKELVRVIGRLVAELVHKGRSLAEETSSSPEEAAAAAAVPAPSAWEGYASSMFSSIMNRGSQLAATLQASATQRAEAAAADVKPSHVQQQQQQGNSSPTPSEEETKLERSDSYDSLSSFIASRRNAASSSSPKMASPPTAAGAAQQQQQTQTWGSYISGWAWSSGSAATPSKGGSDDKSAKTD